MKVISHISKIVVLFLAIFSASNAVGQNTLYYAFIPNEAGDIDRDGFDIGYHSIYSEWDLNSDNKVSESEFYTVMFHRLDSNKDGSLSSKEWDLGQNYIFSQVSGFTQLDTNKDKMIKRGEFDSGIKFTGLFRSYDSDQNGYLNRKELNAGVYNSMDLDGSGIIQKNEFTTVRNLFIN